MARSALWRGGVGSVLGLVGVSFLGSAGCSSAADDGTRTNALGQALGTGNLAAAPDPTEVGPEAVTSAEYQFPAAVDADVLSNTSTEIWGRVYRPETLGSSPHPVIVFLHGNHSTCGTGANPRQDTNCQYTSAGTCPANFVVVPNHLGYAYVAERLASHGYVVVSINANRGITCGSGVSGDSGLNLARGRLILKHLQRLSEWNANGGTPESLGVDLQGKLDFSQVGIVGHSRGGEGARAAYNQYRDAGSVWPSKILSPVNFRGVFEIGPVDGQTGRTLNADGTVWSVLLPMCDGDVSSLSGIIPYDRMLQVRTESPSTPKSTFTVWGANHNFYNTEWQRSDSTGCADHAPLFPATMGSPEQRTTGLASIMAFVRANVGPSANPSFNQVLNPSYDLPAVVTDVARVDRGYTDSPNSSVTGVFEDFDQATGTNTHGTANEAVGITISHGTVPRHASVQKAGVISWQTGSEETYFQSNWAAAGEGRDVTTYKTLDLRISRQKSDLNPVDPTNLSIRLALADGTLSDPVKLGTYTDLRGPVGGVSGTTNRYHPILQSARIPLTHFTNADLTKVRGVRIVFNETASGAIYLANLRLSTVGPEAPPASLASAPSAPNNAFGPTRGAKGSGNMIVHTKGNVIRGVRAGAPADPANGAASATPAPAPAEIELETGENFPVRDALAVLRIGDREYNLSRHPNGDTRRIVFTLPEGEFAGAANSASGNQERVMVHYGDPEAEKWDFGRLDTRTQTK